MLAVGSRLCFARARYFSTNVAKINFDDSKFALKSKTTSELLLASAVFKLCSYSAFVRNSNKLISLSESVLGEKITMAIIRRTFFKHFCAGIDGQDIQLPISRLRENGVGSILDYAAEADISASSSTSVAEAEEATCDANLKLMMESIAASSQSPDAFTAIKLTALGRTVVLERCSQLLTSMVSLFHKCHNSSSSLKGKVSADDFFLGLKSAGLSLPDSEELALFRLIDSKSRGFIELDDWIDYFTLDKLSSKSIFAGVLPCLSESEAQSYIKLQNRVSMLSEFAKEKQVKLLVDAEQTYFQAAIDNLVISIQKSCNLERPVVFNTYQCYLKDSKSRVQSDILRARREGFYFAAKLVRGAYMVSERERALELGYPDPIHPEISATHTNYDECLGLIFDNIDISSVLIASHNQKSIEFATEQMRTRNLPTDRVFFGQLLGMADHLTFILGANGFKAYKYVPYGPVKEVIPYLIRRAQENSNLLGGASKDRKMVWDEFLRRTHLIPTSLAFSALFCADYFM